MLYIDPALTAPLAIGAGAIFGALSRYYVTILLAQRLGNRFPYGTFVINLSGALLMGFVTTLALGKVISPSLQLFIATGFLGSYTTFSTYALDTANLARSRGQKVALFYWAGSAIIGGASVKLGISLARLLV